MLRITRFRMVTESMGAFGSFGSFGSSYTRNGACVSSVVVQPVPSRIAPILADKSVARLRRDRSIYMICAGIEAKRSRAWIRIDQGLNERNGIGRKMSTRVAGHWIVD